MQRTNCPNVLPGQLCPSVTLPNTRKSSPPNTPVIDIIHLIANVQMLGVDTLWIVARVQYQSLGIASVRQQERYSMREKVDACHLEPTVSINVRSKQPPPTITRFVHVRPETINVTPRQCTNGSYTVVLATRRRSGHAFSRSFRCHHDGTSFNGTLYFLWIYWMVRFALASNLSGSRG